MYENQRIIEPSILQKSWSKMNSITSVFPKVVNFGCLSNVPSFDEYPTSTYLLNTLIFAYANFIEHMSQSPLIVSPTPTAFNVEKCSVKEC